LLTSSLTSFFNSASTIFTIDVWCLVNRKLLTYSLTSVFNSTSTIINIDIWVR
jgi:hypothetical protein